MRPFIGIILFIFLLNMRLLAQKEKIPFSEEEFIADSTKIYIPKSWRPQFKFDTRTTLFSKQRVNLYGYDLGILVKNKLRMTLGYLTIDENLPNDQIVIDVRTKQNLRMHMGSANLELNYLRKRFFSLGFPLEVGFGSYRLSNFSADSTLYEVKRISGYVIFSNFGLSGTFTPIRWLGLKGMVGYRKAVIASQKEFNFNGVFSAIALSIDIQEIVRDIKMYKLKKRYYGKSFRKFEGFTDIIAD